MPTGSKIQDGVYHQVQEWHFVGNFVTSTVTVARDNVINGQTFAMMKMTLGLGKTLVDGDGDGEFVTTKMFVPTGHAVYCSLDITLGVITCWNRGMRLWC